MFVNLVNTKPMITAVLKYTRKPKSIRTLIAPLNEENGRSTQIGDTMQEVGFCRGIIFHTNNNNFLVIIILDHEEQTNERRRESREGGRTPRSRVYIIIMYYASNI